MFLFYYQSVIFLSIILNQCKMLLKYLISNSPSMTKYNIVINHYYNIPIYHNS